MFIKADAENNWIRVPVVNYLRACPLPEAEKALEKLKEVDPESVRRANTFFSIPVPEESNESKTSSAGPDDQETHGRTRLAPFAQVHSVGSTDGCVRPLAGEPLAGELVAGEPLAVGRRIGDVALVDHDLTLLAADRRGQAGLRVTVASATVGSLLQRYSRETRNVG